eukprot:CAMPEP_0197657458 /NCGR_PEP_ID=MMETSP1338-20131121/44638_1 /TAXON_ID=43686 ORGANISM="Pelagodinium beii, Strain RCC1491" /NCGR_SAMPLE_ID=MMETSP1338 /ASSEMBLY_ACC=CAM_ASM_000754 /LENGTH=68 /DNA_ID=CAMNT_0043233827 /DNA_START=815 /DNA_END=1021 /DNA_ORIENTATION=-
MVNTLAVGFVVTPLTLVDVAICMNKLPEALCEAISPLAVEARTIRPLLQAMTIALIALPLATVLDAVL